MQPLKTTPCPITLVIDHISAKWTVEILREIALGPVRTRRFLVHIPGISMKSLRQRLQAMEDAGLVKRTQYEGRPLKVEYSITERGKQLFDIFAAMKRLGDEWTGSTCVCSFETCGDVQCEMRLLCPHRRERTRQRGACSLAQPDYPDHLNGSSTLGESPGCSGCT